MNRLETRVPPPAVAFFFAALMWAVTRTVPSYGITVPARVPLVLGLTVIGVAIAAAGAIEFRRARTTVNPLSPGKTTALVVAGIYRFTRNPMYLGMAIVLLAWAVYLSHPLPLLGGAAFVAFITRFQILPEERALRALFPGAFDEYARRVRRWI